MFYKVKLKVILYILPVALKVNTESVVLLLTLLYRSMTLIDILVAH